MFLIAVENVKKIRKSQALKKLNNAMEILLAQLPVQNEFPNFMED